MSGKQTVARSLVWAALDSGGFSILLFITTIILARLLGPADFGMAELALSVVGVLNFIVTSLFMAAIIQRQDLQADHLHTAFWISLSLGVLFSGGCWLFSDWVESVFRQPGLGSVLAWMSLSLVFSSASTAHVAKFYRDMNFKAVALRSLGGRSAGAVVGGLMAFAGYGVWSLVAQQLVASSVASLCVWVGSSYRPEFRMSLPRLRELLRFGISEVIAGGTLEIGRRAFFVLIGYYCGTTVVGFLSITIRFVQTAQFILSAGVAQLGFTLFSRRQDDPAALRAGYTTASEFCGLVTLPLFVGAAVTADKIVPVILGQQWTPVVPLLAIAAIAGAVTMVRSFNSVIFKAVGHPEIHALMSIGSVALMLGGVLLFGRYSLIYAIIAWTMQQATIVLEVIFIRRFLNITIWEQFKIFFPSITATAIMALLLLVIDDVITIEVLNSMRLLLLVIIGGLVYLSLIYLIKRDLLQRFVAFLSHGLAKKGQLP